MTLRKSLIRLAHENPEIRGSILEVLAETGKTAGGRVESVVEEVVEIGRTMQNRIRHRNQGGGDSAWLRSALLEEVRRLESSAKVLRMLLERDEGYGPLRAASNQNGKK